MNVTRQHLVNLERLRLLRALAVAEEQDQHGIIALYRGQLRALNLQLGEVIR